MKDFAGRVAVVTGAAGGIGLAMAKHFAALGMRLVMADIEAARLHWAVGEVEALGAQAIAVSTDVMSEAQVNALADAAYQRFGAVHLLCNNAGVAVPALRARAWETSIADWRWIHEVNFMGVLFGVRAFVPRMLAAGEEGHVINTASIAGLVTGAHPYHVSKHAVTCFTEGLFKDLKAISARVSASVLCPGLINTAIMEAERNRPQQFGPAMDVSLLPSEIQAMASSFREALGRGFDPAQVAQLVEAGVREDRFYLLPAQPELLRMVHARMQGIMDERNPAWG
jgi:NAD(P)-dependent dehydrogenase (short-subunit alcohol dehydrogenase family)